MAPRRAKSGFQLDWVVVSLETLRRRGAAITLTVLALAVAGGTYYYFHEPPSRRAERLLTRASAAEEEARRAGITEALSAEFEQASHQLDEARSHWQRQDFPACIARAEDALRRFELLLGLLSRSFVGTGQIVALHGKVEIQRGNQGQWERGREKQTLDNGDFVKTSSDGSVEILFSDGTVYRVGPDTLLEVHRDERGGAESARGEVKLKVGQVNVYTSLHPSVVLTDTVKAEVERDSRIGVDVSDDQSATVSAFAGRASVTGGSGERVSLGERQAVTAAASGRLGERRAVPEPPALLEPPASFLLDLDATSRISLRWRPVAGATSYAIQVNRSRVFDPTTMEVEAKSRPETSATLNVLRPGSYHWRVAALGAGSVRSEWSPPRTFRAVAGRRLEELADTTPPKLDVQRPRQMGNFFLVQGVTEPGVTVTVNGEVVTVAGDGTFKKAVALHHEGSAAILIRAMDPSGNTTERTEPVFVEVE